MIHELPQCLPDPLSLPKYSFLFVIYTQSIIFQSYRCTRDVVYVRLNTLIIPDLVFTSTSSFILSDIDPSGVFLMTSVKGLNLSPLKSLFIALNVSFF